MYFLLAAAFSRKSLNKTPFSFFLKVPGNLAAKIFSSSMEPEPMYSFMRLCSEEINTSAFSLVMLSVAGKVFSEAGRFSLFKVVISESRH